MQYGDMTFYPYSEGLDPFIETFEGFSSRLYINENTMHMTFNPVPSGDILDRFYNGNFRRSVVEPTVQSEFTPQVVEIMRGVLGYAQAVAKFSGPFTFHDIGCGFGAGVWGMQQLGVNATGNEANRDWVNRANEACNNGLYAGDLAEVMRKVNRKVDMFFTTHVLEHVPNPMSVMSTMSDYLSDSGIVYICVPNGISDRVMRMGRRPGLDYGNFPMHLTFYTPRSMAHMLSTVGLEVIQIETRPLDEVDDERKSAAWSKEYLTNLHGGELFVCAAKPTNKAVLRQDNIKYLIDAAHARFDAACRYGK